MKFINLTAHDITEVTTGIVIPASGTIARVNTSKTKVATHAGIPMYKTEVGSIEGLPEPETDVIYIVSGLSLGAVPAHRTDVVSPGNLQKNPTGQILGCLGFRTK